MNKFRPEDLQRDYNLAWIVCPDGVVRQFGGVGGGVVELHRDSGRTVIPIADLDWKHVAIPQRLGYRTVLARNQGLIYVRRKVARQTFKGLSHNTVRLEICQHVYNAMATLGIDSSRYTALPHGRIDQNAAEQIFNPQFSKLDTAIEAIKRYPSATGAALNEDFAVVVGPTKNQAFLLLWKTVVIAASPDGERWRVLNQAYKDSINRGLGKLQYAN